ncbi:hypothetical protein [Actinocorallia aurantiaca]|uniref:Transcriptional regulator n=1 Tax=Actinocorallia aurantiaca TaxID=46204 RepID=A0ABP6GMM1_9ACTN
MTSTYDTLDHLDSRLRVFAESLISGHSPIALRVSLKSDTEQAARLIETSTHHRIADRALALQGWQFGLLSTVCLAAGDVPAARSYALMARSAGLRSGNRRAEAFAAIRRATVELHHGTAFDACKLSAAALEQARSPLARQEGDDLYIWAAVTLARAAARRSREDRTDLLDVYRRARSRAEAAARHLPDVSLGALSVTASQITAGLGDAAADAGEEDAVELIETGLRAYPKTGSRLISIRTSLNLARAVALAGRTDEAVTIAMATLGELHRYEKPGDGEVRTRGLRVVKALDGADGSRELLRLVRAV